MFLSPGWPPVISSCPSPMTFSPHHLSSVTLTPWVKRQWKKTLDSALMWLSMVMYLSQFYQLFRDTLPPTGETQDKIVLSLLFEWWWIVAWLNVWQKWLKRQKVFILNQCVVSDSLHQSSDLRSAFLIPAFLLSRLGHSHSRNRNPKVPAAFSSSLYIFWFCVGAANM